MERLGAGKNAICSRKSWLRVLDYIDIYMCTYKDIYIYIYNKYTVNIRSHYWSTRGIDAGKKEAVDD